MRFPTGALTTHAVSAAGESGDVDSVVLQYLRRKGYKKAADALTSERGALSLRSVAASVAGDAQVVQQIALHDSAQYTTERYNQASSLFASWVLSSLDMYKVRWFFFFFFPFFFFSLSLSLFLSLSLCFPFSHPLRPLCSG